MEDCADCNLLKVVETQAKNEMSQFKNRLARQLKVEVQDFESIEQDPMTVDLGENMRIQLQSVFRTLRQYGIPI